MKRHPPEDRAPYEHFPLFMSAGAPFQAHSSTSKAAAEAMLHGLAALRARVYECIVTAPDGMTDEEGQCALGMTGNTYRPRRRELEQAGYVKDSGRRRKTESGRNAVVWMQRTP